MTCQIDCNNGLQPFSIYGLLKMLSGNAEPCNTELSTDKRLIVLKIPFIETSEIVLRSKLKKINSPHCIIFWKMLSTLPYSIQWPRHKSLKSNCYRSLHFLVTLAWGYMMNMESNHHTEWSHNGTQQQNSCRPEKARSAGHQRAWAQRESKHNPERDTVLDPTRVYFQGKLKLKLGTGDSGFVKGST